MQRDLDTQKSEERSMDEWSAFLHNWFVYANNRRRTKSKAFKAERGRGTHLKKDEEITMKLELKQSTNKTFFLSLFRFFKTCKNSFACFSMSTFCYLIFKFLFLVFRRRRCRRLSHFNLQI